MLRPVPALLVVALLLLAGLAVLEETRALPTPGAATPGARGGAVASAAPSLLGAPSRSAFVAPPVTRAADLAAVSRLSGPTNVLVDAPCNATGANAEVQQAYDPSRGYLYEAWIGCGGIGFSRSLDGGATFEPAVTVPGSGNVSSWDPSIALAPNGTLYVAFMVGSPGDAPVVAWSFDGGASFAGYAYAFTPASTEFSDRDFLAVAPNGSLFLTWDYSPNASLDTIGCAYGGSCYFTNGDYNIVCVRSDDGGRTWTTPVPVDPEYPNGGAPAGPLLVTPNGTVDVLYEDYNISGATHALGLGRNYFSASFDGGLRWSPPIAVGNGTFPDTVWWIDGALARDAGGTLYATYDALNGSLDSARVAVSTDDGVAWTEHTVNPDHDAAAHDLVTAIGAEAGAAYVAWMSNNTSGLWSAFEAPLWDNGTVEGPVTQVSDQLGLVGYWIGDTLGLSYLGKGRVAMSWSYGVYKATGTASQVYEAVVPGVVPGSPTITGIAPGHGNATVSWVPPGGTPPTGYRLEWGAEGLFTNNLTVGAANLSVGVSPLLAFARYSFRVIAFDSAGDGLPSSAVNLTLTAWTVVAGTLSPATGHVNVDGQPVPLVGGAFSVNTSYSPHAVSGVATGFAPGAAIALPIWNGTASVRLVLVPLNGTVRGTVYPATADLTWDGAPVSVAANGSYLISAVAGGPYELAASYPGLVSFSTNLTLTSNTTLWQNVTLAPVPGTLHVFVTPANATVVVANATVALDATGNGSLLLAPGAYTWSASAPGYQNGTGTTTVRSGVVTNLTVTLGPVPPGPRGGTGGRSLFSSATLVPALLGALALVLVGVLVLAIRGRRPPPTEPDAELRVDAEPVDEGAGGGPGDAASPPGAA